MLTLAAGNGLIEQLCDRLMHAKSRRFDVFRSFPTMTETVSCPFARTRTANQTVGAVKVCAANAADLADKKHVRSGAGEWYDRFRARSLGNSTVVTVM